ncbi:MAG: hypothetical protein ACD_26C00043G0003 [uncultured bacterium]|nr:MAG: hypothetical protein ACD_26C00043G0003 [uncultured bacterium]
MFWCPFVDIFHLVISDGITEFYAICLGVTMGAIICKKNSKRLLGKTEFTELEQKLTIGFVLNVCPLKVSFLTMLIRQIIQISFLK